MVVVAKASLEEAMIIAVSFSNGGLEEWSSGFLGAPKAAFRRPSGALATGTGPFGRAAASQHIIVRFIAQLEKQSP